jgi:O-antigen ligase
MLTRVSPRSLQRKLLYLLPISLLLGTNIPVLSIAGRTVYIGTNELIIFLFLSCLVYESLADGLKLTLRLPTGVAWGIFLFSFIIVYSAVINIITSQDFGSMKSYIEIVRWFEYLFIFPIVMLYVRTEDEVVTILKIMFYCLVISICYSIYQVATFNFSEQRIYGLFVSGANREEESISNPNVLGALFMGSSLFFLAFSLRNKFKYRIYFRILLTPSIVVMVLTLSRSAFLGFLIGTLVLMAGYRKKILITTTAALIIILTLIVLAASMDDVSSRIVNSISMSSDTAAGNAILDRWTYWNLALAKVPKNLWFGVGYGDFEKNFGFLTPDNQYIEFLATTGLVGLTTLIFMLCSIFVVVLRFDSKRNDFLHALKFSYIAIFLGFVVANITGGLFGNPRLLGLFWLLTAIVIRTFQLRNNSIISSPLNIRERFT